MKFILRLNVIHTRKRDICCLTLQRFISPHFFSRLATEKFHAGGYNVEGRCEWNSNLVVRSYTIVPTYWNAYRVVVPGVGTRRRNHCDASPRAHTQLLVGTWLGQKWVRQIKKSRVDPRKFGLENWLKTSIMSGNCSSQDWCSVHMVLLILSEFVLNTLWHSLWRSHECKCGKPVEHNQSLPYHFLV